MYQQRFAASADAAVKAGFVLAADRPALLAYEKAGLAREPYLARVGTAVADRVS